jgi:hypothetical protein
MKKELDAMMIIQYENEVLRNIAEQYATRQ